MTVKAKFEELKEKLKKNITVYKSGCFDIGDMEVGIYSVKELIETGFVKKKIDLLLDSTPITDIEHYFQEECLNIKCFDIEEFQIAVDGTIGEFIFGIKYITVRSKLNQELSNYLKGIKNDT